MVNEHPARNEEIVDGIYPLGALITRSREGVIYETKFGEGDEAVPAVIKIREVEPAEAENLARRLRNSAQLAHPNLLKIYASGSSTFNGSPVFYIVVEWADESLEAVLSDRALTESETRDMLAPTLEALDYLHKRGYSHSRLKPSNVLAVNDRLKLSTDSVIHARDSEIAEDMRALGVLIVQALTRKTPREGWESQDLEAIPQPLADIVRQCLDSDRTKRWNVEQVKARLNRPAIVVEKMPPPEEVPEAASPKAGLPKWIYAGLAVLLLVVVLAAVMRKKDSAPASTPVAAVAQTPSVPATQQEVQALATAPAEAIENAATRNAVSQTTTASGQRKASGWSVIVAAYRSRELAEKRMREMTKRWQHFDITVFEPQTDKTLHLVVLGHNLSEDQAETLRKRAVDSGLPRDTYIKRVM